MKKIVRWGGRAVMAAAIAAITAACGISGPSSPSEKPQTGRAVRISENAPPSAFVAVVDGTAVGRALSWLVSATARPREVVDILQAGVRPRVLLGASSPVSARVTVAGKPAAPSPGATSYLWAEYRKNLKTWRGKISVAERDVAIRTHAATSAWARGLPILAAVTGTSSTGGEPSGLTDPSSLADECKLAMGALAGLGQEAGDRFGQRRVLLLYVPDLGGIPHVAELAGDDVIVVTTYLPSAARASTAQAKLLDAGAARATVLGPEATAAEIAQLVTAGLSQKVITETLSGSVLFASGGTALLPGADRVLTSLLAPLRRPGAIAVVNGYAYALGSARRDYKFSLARAAAVARFLEDDGISASSLIVVGHGASHLVTRGSSRANSRVLVVIEEP